MNAELPPWSTCRLQFSADFRLEDARGLVPYLSRMGITHVYASPLLRPRNGSSHGYDNVDPRMLNPAVGDESDLRNLVATLRAYGMGLILDIVPNHMAASSENPAWQQVLTYGQASDFARWFDIDWRLPDSEFWGRVLVPVLGDRLPQVLSREEIRIEWEDGRFRVRYYEHVFPLDPATVPQICRFGFEQLEATMPEGHAAPTEIRGILEKLTIPADQRRDRRTSGFSIEETEQLLSRLAQLIEVSPRLHEWATSTAEAVCTGEGAAERMQELLDSQSYRLVHWRRAARAINYRRFFDINDLISIRQEDPEVFFETHAVVGRWIREGLIDGVRIDHIDGLRDPRGYLERLRELIRDREAPSTCLVFVEKILSHDEHLPRDWQVAGTTGYEFLNAVESLFLSPDGYGEIEQNYQRMLRRPTRFRHVAAWGKRRVLRNELSAFVGRLADILHRIVSHQPGHESLTERDCVDAIVEVVVGLPVYRTYLDAKNPRLSRSEKRHLTRAFSRARRSQRASPEAMEVLEEVLLLHRLDELPENEIQERINFTERFQQLTGPATAKGIEDTALYAYVPLVSRNEVGSEPDTRLDDAAAFLHEANELRARTAPHSMLCVTTHDTKRTADVRARLDVLSEIPRLWWAWVSRWRKVNAPLRRRVDGRSAPRAAAEYLFYQSLVGIWPFVRPGHLEEDFPDRSQLKELEERLVEYMRKAAREAKTRTSWVDGNAEYEEALEAFVRGAMDPEREGHSGTEPVQFLRDVHALVARISRAGIWNALSRTLVQFTAPGTPDLYQGDELWNLAMVDPDNRRPVDFELRRTLLDDIVLAAEGLPEQQEELLSQLLAEPEDGRIKLLTVRTALLARRESPELFTGSYRPAFVDGVAADHVFAFLRESGESACLVVVPRLVTSLVSDAAAPPVGGDLWGDTVLHLPESLADRSWVCAFTRQSLSPASSWTETHGGIPMGELLSRFPVGLYLAGPAAD
ncbi:MAG: malto-oligosyltrehalose synthase [Planctomycetaceae bacterium]|nr:malto-oligosyltrehalose synthase [Planctomycetaceae bacterium]